MTTQSSFQFGHRRSLDGLRGVAILLVLLDHGGVLGDGFGFVGVNTFFVLSGFLITTLLVLEWEERGAVSLSRFYLRRALRLLPALVAMLAVFAGYVSLTMSGPALRDALCEVFYALFYSMNWAKVFNWSPTLELAHTWSLSLEEQFYLCWPLLLGLLLRRSTRTSILCWLTLGIIVSAGVRIFLVVGSVEVLYGPDRLTAGLDTRADSLLFGCLVAVAATSNLLGWLGKNSWLTTALAIAAAVGLAALGACRAAAPRMVCAGWLAESACAALIIAQLMTCPGSILHRVLENRMLVYLGMISYGLYIWHYPILRALVKFHLPSQSMIYCLPVLAVAVGSYYLLERPFLRWKTRFQRVRS